MNDIIPPNNKRRSIRDIPIPDKNKESNQEHFHDNAPDPTHKPKQEGADHYTNEMNHDRDTSFEPKRAARPYPRRPRKNSTGKKILLSVVGIAILLFFVVVAFRNGAEVTVTPKTDEIAVALTLNSSSNGGEGLTHTVEEVSISVSETVAPTGEEEVSEKASGKLTIYNEFSDESQRLITQTRFETPDGKIYRIQESVVVPGYTENASGDITPGTISVEVVADEAGESFNIGKTDFTIPGFAGQPQFDSMYAKSETAMTGGFEGIRKFVDEEQEEEVRALLQQKAITALQNEIANVYKDMYGFSTTTLQTFSVEQTDSDESITFTMSGTAKVVVYDKNTFNDALASASITSFDADNEDVVILNVDDLNSFTVVSADGNADTATVTINGQAQLEWVVNKEQLKEVLAGTERKTFRNVLESVPGIQKAEVTISPFWKNVFPDDAEKIEIIVEGENGRCGTDARC